MKVKKRCAWLLFFVMIASIWFMPIGALRSNAATISSGEVQARLNSVMQQYPKGSLWTQNFAGGSQCYAFAHKVFNTIFGRGSRQVADR